MKIVISARPVAQRGGVLLITLLIVLFIGVSLGSFLIVVSSQNRSVMRSLAWNNTVPALEAGIEEALTQIHYTGVTNLHLNGWTRDSQNWYRRIRALGDGSAFIVRVQPVDPPVIVATGVAPAPISGRAIGNSEASILSAAVDTANFVRRTVRVTTKRDALWAKGMVAKGEIDLLGNNVASDSFDSSDPLYNTNGRYDPAKRKSAGDVATNSSLTNSLDVGNANLMGHVSTGPGGTIAIGPNGSVGDRNWVSSGRKGIQPGWSTDDMNVEFPAVEAPFTSGTIPAGGTVNGTNYNLVMTGGEYAVSGLSGKVYVSGDTTLYVSSSFSLSGQEFIYIAPNSSLRVYCAAPSASIGGKGIANVSGNALAFRYYGLPGNTSLSFNGNAAFSGVIYAPNAAFSLGGGGNNTYDFVGASITASVRMNGHFNFHYDEALAKFGDARDYIPTSWNEMDPGYGASLAYYGGEGEGEESGGEEPSSGTSVDVVTSPQ